MSYSVRPSDYLTTAEASKFLNVTRFTVLNWIKSGKLQSASTFGGHSRIPRGVLKAAMRQIKTVNRSVSISNPLPPTTSGVVHCWESKEIIDLNCKHTCNKCLVFKKKVDLCFLSVREYGSLKVECKHDCLSCAYLANHHPQERKMMARLRSKAARQAEANNAATVDVNGILKKVFYNSGRLVAKIGQLSTGTEHKKHYQRISRKVRKG